MRKQTILKLSVSAHREIIKKLGKFPHIIDTPFGRLLDMSDFVIAENQYPFKGELLSDDLKMDDWSK